MIIIQQPWGGLGDNLQFSTIPEMGHKLGIPVYVSTRNAYRNQDIKKLVWDSNPFVSGFVDQDGNIPTINLYSNNHIINWEKTLFNISENYRPKIYYTPKYIDEVKDKTLIDPGAVSLPINFDSIISDNADAILLNCKKKYTNKNINTKNIFEWIDLMTSCQKVICQYSGSSVAMSAYNRKCDVYMPRRSNPSCGFKLPPHEYHTI